MRPNLLLAAFTILINITTPATAAQVESKTLAYDPGPESVAAAAIPASTTLNEFRAWRSCEELLGTELFRLGREKSTLEMVRFKERGRGRSANEIKLEVDEAKAQEEQIRNGLGWQILPTGKQSTEDCKRFPLGSGELLRRLLFLASQPDRDELQTLVFNPAIHSMHLQRDKNNRAAFLARISALTAGYLEPSESTPESNPSKKTIFGLNIGLEFHSMCARWLGASLQQTSHPDRSLEKAILFADRLLRFNLSSDDREYVTSVKTSSTRLYEWRQGSKMSHPAAFQIYRHT
jgi:hypothetical protein